MVMHTRNTVYGLTRSPLREGVITVNSMLKLAESFDEAQDERRFLYH